MSSRSLPSSWRWAIAKKNHPWSAVAALVVVAAAAWIACRRSVVSRWPWASQRDDESVVEFVDHRSATFSLFRRDVLDRLERIDLRLENVRCQLCGSPPARGPMVATPPPPASLLQSADPAAATSPPSSPQKRSDAAFSEHETTGPMSSPAAAGLCMPALLELDELLTKLMVDVDGAPVAGMEDLRAERKALLRRILDRAEELARLRQRAAVAQMS